MGEIDDFEIDGGEREPETGEQPKLEPGGPERPAGPALPYGLVALALLLVLVIAAVLILFLRPGGKPRPVGPASPPVAATIAPPPSPAAPSALPSLAESDGFVRELARGLSTHPQLGAWLSARGLVRTLSVAVQNLAEGRSPASFLAFLTPRVRFQAVSKRGRVLADPRSHAAYDEFADAVASLDPGECARVYRTLAPLFGAAYAELGYPEGDFPKALAQALETVATAPIPDGEIMLRRGAIFLEFADPKLEALPLAQKHLLRTGPRNARILQKKARELAAAFGPTPRS